MPAGHWEVLFQDPNPVQEMEDRTGFKGGLWTRRPELLFRASLNPTVRAAKGGSRERREDGGEGLRMWSLEAQELCACAIPDD